MYANFLNNFLGGNEVIGNDREASTASKLFSATVYTNMFKESKLRNPNYIQTHKCLYTEHK